MSNQNTKTNRPADWDIRVRERNLRKGILDEKEVEKHLGQLQNVADQSELIGTQQPALGGRED